MARNIYSISLPRGITGAELQAAADHASTFSATAELIFPKRGQIITPDQGNYSFQFRSGVIYQGNNCALAPARNQFAVSICRESDITVNDLIIDGRVQDFPQHTTGINGTILSSCARSKFNNVLWRNCGRKTVGQRAGGHGLLVQPFAVAGSGYSSTWYSFGDAEDLEFNGCSVQDYSVTELGEPPYTRVGFGALCDFLEESVDDMAWVRRVQYNGCWSNAGERSTFDIEGPRTVDITLKECLIDGARVRSGFDIDKGTKRVLLDRCVVNAMGPGGDRSVNEQDLLISGFRVAGYNTGIDLDDLVFLGEDCTLRNCIAKNFRTYPWSGGTETLNALNAGIRITATTRTELYGCVFNTLPVGAILREWGVNTLFDANCNIEGTSYGIDYKVYDPSDARYITYTDLSGATVGP